MKVAAIFWIVFILVIMLMSLISSKRRPRKSYNEVEKQLRRQSKLLEIETWDRITKGSGKSNDEGGS